MHALIVANGEHPPLSLIRELRADADLFIATDGAANALLCHGELPDAVLGDFDSLHPDTAEALPPHLLIPACDQEASDLDKAVAHAVAQGALRVTILGAGGGRIDHTFTAVSLLLKYPPPLDVVIRYPSSAVRLVTSSAVVRGQPGDTLSLIAFAPAEGVCLEGVEWPLRNETLLPGSRGVSNRLIETEARLTVRSGWLLACHLFDL